MIAILNTPTAPIDPLLNDLSRRAVNFFWEHTHPVTGLTKDRAVNKPGGDDYTIASCASMGFALVANAIAAERGWKSRKEARDRTLRALRYANTKYPHHKGWLYHFVHWEKGNREWKSEASSIDTAIFLCGAIAARQYFRDVAISREVDRFIKRIDWTAMRTDGGKDPKQTLFSMGWHPESGYIDGRWGKSTFDECKLIYILGYGLSDTPASGWDQMARKLETYEGIEFITGGPLFLHQMSESFYDFRGKRDRLGFDYGIASRNAARAQIKYVTNNPGKFKAYGPDFFGLSASDGPNGYNAYGAPGWTNDDGTITPTAAVAVIGLGLPDEALRFAKNMRANHQEAWGEYGFPNALNPTKNWIDPDVIGIDLGMMMCAIENARDRFVWRLSMSHPGIRRGYARAGLRPSSGDALRF